jgi:hypothetical protein
VSETEIEDEKSFYPTLEPPTSPPTGPNSTSAGPSPPPTTPTPEAPESMLAVLQHYWLFVAMMGFAILLSVWIGFCLLVSEGFFLSQKISMYANLEHVCCLNFLEAFSILSNGASA